MHERQIDFDVAVVGGGIAGSEAARALGEKGFKVALIEKRSKMPDKSWMLNAGNFNPNFIHSLKKRNLLIPLDHYEVVHASNQRLTFKRMADGGGGTPETFATFHPEVVSFVREAFGDNIEIIQFGVTSSVEDEKGVELELFDGKVIRTSYLVDASGDYSPISRKHQIKGKERLLSDNPLVLWLKGIRAYGEFKEGTVIGPVGREIGISWILPYSKNFGDIVACNICRLSELGKEDKTRTMKNLISFCELRNLCHIEKTELNFEGFIRCEPIKENVARSTKRVFNVGSSAGMGSPLLAEVFPAAYKWAGELADFIAEGKLPIEFYREWREKRQMFPYDLELAMIERRYRQKISGKEPGRNAPLYRAIIDYLPEEAQKEILRSRKIPQKYLPMVISIILKDPHLALNLAELGIFYGRVKIGNLLEKNLP